ncbi:MAG: DUF2497 domain-containing protein [Novosphingobium sp.]
MSQAGEPSVEEILASIKKVIARDNRDALNAPARGKSPPAAASVSLSEDEILDLTEVDFADDEPGEAAESPLITETARASMRESLAALSVMAQPGAQPQIVRSGETSLEGMTRELLRPALAEWLDKNLPPLVESMVSAEIARIVGKKA